MIFPERVRVATTLTGTGPVTCSTTAVSAEYRTLATAGAAVGNVFPYAIGIAGSAEWECGLGTITAISSGAVTFSRTPTASSNGNALVDFSAGTKEVVCTPLGATLTKWENGTSARVVCTSSICVSDSVLDMTPTTGADQTAKLQAILDIAADDKPLLVIWDGAYSVKAKAGDLAALRIRSNTTIRALPGCGAVILGANPACMISNYNPQTDPTKRVDKNITIEGGIWHGNRAAQEIKYSLIVFFGVDNLNMLGGMEIRNAKAFAWYAQNCYHVTINKGRIDFGEGQGDTNTDGYHLNGPCQYIDIQDVEIFNNGDDAIAFNADDAWLEHPANGPYDNLYGPITDVNVDGVRLKSVRFGLRMLTGGSRMDRFRIRNISGSTSAYTITIDNYREPTWLLAAGRGNIGTVEIDGINVTNGDSPMDWGQMAVRISCQIENISIKNVIKRHFNNSLFPLIWFGGTANIGQMSIAGLRSRNYNGGTYQADQIHLISGARIDQLDITDAMFYADSPVNGCPIKVEAGAMVRQFTLDGQVQNFTAMLQNLGTITNLRDRSFAGVAAVSEWNFGSGYTEATNDHLKYAGIISSNPNPIATSQTAIKKSVDTYGGNVQLSSRILLTADDGASNVSTALIVRGASAQPWTDNTRCYFLSISANGGVFIGYKNGANTTSVTATIGTAVLGVAYNAIFTAKGNVLSAAVQRVSDGFWLQPNGTFAAAQATALSGVDSGIAAGTGMQYGVYSYASSPSNTSATAIDYSNIAIAAAP